MRHSLLTSDDRKGKTLIIGLGNTILSDDGVGIYIVRELEKVLDNSDIITQEASMGGLELIDIIADYKKVILIDSILSDHESIGSLIELDLDDVKGGSAWTRHQVSLKEAITLARKLKMNITSDITIYGVVVKDISTFNEDCTPEIKSSLPAIIETIKAKILFKIHDCPQE
jgi:hydrogenase maturation protease